MPSIRIKLAISSGLIGLGLALSGCVTTGSGSHHPRQSHYSHDRYSHKYDDHRGKDRYDRDRSGRYHTSDRRQDCRPSKWNDCRTPPRRY